MLHLSSGMEIRSLVSDPHYYKAHWLRFDHRLSDEGPLVLAQTHFTRHGTPTLFRTILRQVRTVLAS